VNPETFEEEIRKHKWVTTISGRHVVVRAHINILGQIDLTREVKPRLNPKKKKKFRDFWKEWQVFRRRVVIPDIESMLGYKLEGVVEFHGEAENES
jgi:hypothetical protein